MNKLITALIEAIPKASNMFKPDSKANISPNQKERQYPHENGLIGKSFKYFRLTEIRNSDTTYPTELTINEVMI
ncbi:MAG: hypothetical protein EBS55_03065 [Flavobacteriaceae bacterium]|nr:hypothetical protein [Flavobacteriaceae bacterium]